MPAHMVSGPAAMQRYAALAPVCNITVSTLITHVVTVVTHLPTLQGWTAKLPIRMTHKSKAKVHLYSATEQEYSLGHSLSPQSRTLACNHTSPRIVF